MDDNNAIIETSLSSYPVDDVDRQLSVIVSFKNLNFMILNMLKFEKWHFQNERFMFFLGAKM